ncbi:uncharacterized protein LOC110627292 isoform X2 [Manihot esculenta]|uniref:uncharacterized protein LOC110627292 isoform X2 n=1 Tax=Manihot esculenta TaxID=3983 RepID=UPI001CC7968F|nr:uncharacterized protein LOC110627292 isoform X2 [Manihot esculenta]
MLENPAPAAQPDSTTIVKRYPPPNQRNRSISRRKSDRLDRSNSLYASDTEKNQQYASPRNLPIIDHVDLGSSNVLKENSRPGLIALDGCCHSEASQLLNNQRPVMYSGSSASAWGHYRFPHQFISSANSGGEMDFLRELRRAILNSSANPSN